MSNPANTPARQQAKAIVGGLLAGVSGLARDPGTAHATAAQPRTRCCRTCTRRSDRLRSAVTATVAHGARGACPGRVPGL